MNKETFFKLLKSLNDLSEWGYFYDGNCTDEFSSIYWQRKTASYAFYITNGDKYIEIKHGRTPKLHDVIEYELRDKYGKLAKQFLLCH